MVVRGHPSLSLTRQCRLLSIGRSSLYDRPKGESAETLALMRRIDALFLKYPFYGARQMVRHLRREGVRIGRRRAARLMRLLGLQAVYRAPRTSAPHLGHRVYPYLLRGLAIERPNHVWCADITYIPVRRGFLYLVAIMDWASRCVLAWRLSNTLDAGFCVEALDEALARHGTPQIFNTDQGSQFTGFAFTARLREAGIRISMDGRGRCMDNIFIERLWRSLKYEAVYLHEIADGFAARRVIGQWIGFYNTERPHSALGGRTPAEAYRGDTPVDMMDKPLRALTTYPQAQQQQQKDRSKRILAAQTSTGIHLENAVSLSDKPTPPHITAREYPGGLLYPFDDPKARFDATTLPPIMAVALPHVTDRYEDLYDEVERFVRAQPKALPGDHFRALFNWLTARLGKKLWIERSGGSLFMASRLLRHFPEARVVHLFRVSRRA